MSYLGNTPTTQSFISGTDYFNGTGAQTAFTLSRTVASINDIQVTVNNVVQQPNSGYTISGTTLTFDQAPSAGTNNVYVRYLSTTTQAITPSQNTVSWNTLDSNIQQDLGVMYKNRIINGNMVIDQRNAGASVTPTDGQYSLDRWKCRLNQSSKYSVQQDAGAVTPPAGFTDYLGVTSLSAFTPASGDYFNFQQLIEGFNFADCGWGTANAKTVTLSFWVRSSLTGTFAGRLCNSAINRVNVFTYSISAANTWEQKSVTIAGDTGGTWIGATNGIGVVLAFDLGSGSSFETATTGSWITTDSIRTASSVRLISTNGATLYITGVQLEVGTQATAFSTAGGSYGAELALCQRYFFTVRSTGASNGENVGMTGIGTGATDLFRTNMALPVTMRAVPTISVSNNSGSGTDLRAFNGGSVLAITALGGQFSNVNYLQADWTMGGSYAVGAYVAVLWRDNITNGWLRASAEL